MKKSALFASLLLSYPTLAENQDIERVVTTATRTSVVATDLPLSVSTIESSTLEQISPAHIEEVLRTVAGANFHRGNGQEYLPALRSPVLSGAGACGGILTLENGIPLRAPGFCNINELFEAHTELAEQIEVVKGPGSAHYGSNAVHGIVNVITPRPDPNERFMALDIGSFGYKRAKWQDAVDFSSGVVGIAASTTRDSGYRDDESVDMDKVSLRLDTQVGQWSVESGLSFMRLDQETASFVEGTNAYKDRALSQTNDDPDAFREARALRLYSTLSTMLENGSELILTPYLRDQSMTFRMHFLPGTPFESNSQTGAGVQSQWVMPLSQTLTLRSGVDVDYTQGELTQTQFAPTQGSAFLQATIPTGRHYDYSVDASVIAPYAQLEWAFDQGSVQFGIRSEYTHYDYTNNMLSGRSREDGTACGFGGCRYSRPESRTDSFTATSPKLGATYQFTEALQGYANVSYGYRAPQATELYRLQRQQQVAELDTEQVRSGEVGVRYINPQWFVQLASYAMHKDNVIFRDSDFFNISNGETRHKGIELETSWQFQPNWRVRLASSYAIHEYANDRLSGGENIRNNAIDSAPRWVGNVQLDWQISDTLSSNVELHWVSGYFTDPENRNEYDGHELVNWRAQWQATASLDIAVRVLNVFDERYAERADFTVFSGERYFPGRPRSYWVTARWNY